MQEDPQVAEQRRRLNLPQGLDPRNYDPRKAIDPVIIESVVRAQTLARAEAQAATQLVLGTIVTLVTSALGFVAALAWNDAITRVLNSLVDKSLNGVKLTPTTISLIHAVIVTIIAIIAVVFIQRVTGRWAKNNALAAASGGN